MPMRLQDNLPGSWEGAYYINGTGGDGCLQRLRMCGAIPFCTVVWAGSHYPDSAYGQNDGNSDYAM